MSANPMFHPQLDDEQTSQQPASEGQPQTAQEKLLAGKYKNVDELERGYDSLFKEGQRLVNRIRELEEVRPTSRESDPWGDPNGVEVTERIDPAARSAARRENPADVLAMAGIPVEAAEELIRRTVQAEIRPLFQGAQARQSVAQIHPEFVQFEGELAQFVAANPSLSGRYNRIYATDPEVALDWVFGEFMRSRGPSPENGASGAQQAAARLDAQLPGRTQPQRTAPDEYSEKYDAARRLAEQTGNWEEVLRLKLGSTVGESHYRGLSGT